MVNTTRADRVLLHSTIRRWTVLRLEPEEWYNFLARVKAGEFDAPDISRRDEQADIGTHVVEDVRPAGGDLGAAEPAAV